MLNHTSELGLQVLLYLALKQNGKPTSPKVIADAVNASPTYTSKVTNLLAKAGLVRAHRGASGGVLLERGTKEITLLEVVEACQGKILADYCTKHENLNEVCSFHKAMHELHECITGVLQQWTLANIVACPCPTATIIDDIECKMKWSKKLLG